MALCVHFDDILIHVSMTKMVHKRRRRRRRRRMRVNSYDICGWLMTILTSVVNSIRADFLSGVFVVG